MVPSTKQEILELLSMPLEEFSSSVIPQAKQVYRQQGGDVLLPVAMLGISNICRCRCLYCGMRAGSHVERYRLPKEDVLASAKAAKEMGLSRLFLISGEDPLYGYETLCEIISGVKALGMHLSLAVGEWSPQQYREFAALGADEYVLKFEMSDPATFDRLNPSTNFAHRMKSIEAVLESGMKLASGNIVEFPGQSTEQLADDILLMKRLGISWAPVIPYLPAKGTPLAAEGGPGRVETILREIAILRLMMPQVSITAQQPGKDLTKGLADEEGNLAALAAGANILFADLLPDAMVQNFSVIDHRAALRLSHIRAMAEKAKMRLG